MIDNPYDVKSAIEGSGAKSSKSESNSIRGFSVSIESSVIRTKRDTPDFKVTEPRNIILTVSTDSGRWIIENTDPEIMIVELANYIRKAGSGLKTSAIEVLAVGLEIGRVSAEFDRLEKLKSAQTTK